MTAIGIDLGTTNSLIAHFADDGPVLIPNALGALLTPSVVSLGDDETVLVGAAARDRLITHPDRTAARFKRNMGSPKDIRLAGKSYRAEDLSSLVLRSLKQDAEVYLGEEVSQAVISVPAYFNETQRRATSTAAKLAGLDVLRLVNEPTAAALAYGLHDRPDESLFLVVDLGGGTFDVSILEMFDDVMEVRASAGDAYLGGEDYTDGLVSYLLRKEYDTLASALKPADLAYVRRTADQVKLALTDQTEATAKLRLDGKEKEVTLTRAHLEEAGEAFTNRLRQPVQRDLLDAGLRGESVDRILLVGGATRMPLVRNLVAKLFKRFPEHAIDPDHVVAMGAAVQAGLTKRHAALEDMVMTDVCPFTLGTSAIEDFGNGEDNEHLVYVPIIERNTVVPVSRSRSFSTRRKGQREVNIDIYQGESPIPRENVLLGELTLQVPHNRKEFESIDVRFTYDNSGLLEVIATADRDGRTERVVIEGNPGSLSKDDIEKRFKELEALKIHPRDGAENTAMMARIKLAYENALGHRREAITRLMVEFETALNSQDHKLAAKARETIGDALADFENDDVF